MRQRPPKLRYSEIDFAGALEAFEEDDRYQSLPLKWFVKDAGERGWFLYEGTAEGDEQEAIAYQSAQSVAETIAEKHNARLVADAEQLTELRESTIEACLKELREALPLGRIEIRADMAESGQIHVTILSGFLDAVPYGPTLAHAMNQARAALNPSHLQQETQ